MNLDKKSKIKGIALVGTVAAIVAWILLSYGIFTVQSSQFQMITSSKVALDAQKLAEVDAALLRMVDYEEITDDSALGELNLHQARGAIRTVTTDGEWEDEITIGEEKLNGGDPDYGRFRVATINIYLNGDTEPRYSMQVPILKLGQTYSRKYIDENFVHNLTDNKDLPLGLKVVNDSHYGKVVKTFLGNEEIQISDIADYNFGNPGFIKFRNGLIIQFGEINTQSGGWTLVSLPTSYSGFYTGFANDIAPPGRNAGYLVTVARANNRTIGIAAHASEQIKFPNISGDSESGFSIDWEYTGKWAILALSDDVPDTFAGGVAVGWLTIGF